MSKKLVGATSYKETRFGILPRNKVIPLEVTGTEKGLLFLKNAALKHRTITPEFIKQVHTFCYSDILLSQAGTFRTVQVTYSGKEASHFSKISEFIKLLCEDSEYSIQHLPSLQNEIYIDRVIELLAHFQHRFVYIHPFVDYNGRMARLFTNYILMRLQLPIIEIPIHNKNDRRTYIKALQKADKGDYRSIETVLSKALNESLEKLGK